MPRPPRPPKPIEYTLAVRRIADEDTGAVAHVLEVRTAREFQNFQYRLNLSAKFDDAAHSITLRIGGVAVPADLMPGEGPAVGAYAPPALKPGAYSVVIRKAPKDVNTFTLTITKARASLTAGAVTGRQFIVAA